MCWIIKIIIRLCGVHERRLGKEKPLDEKDDYYATDG